MKSSESPSAETARSPAAVPSLAASTSPAAVPSPSAAPARSSSSASEHVETIRKVVRCINCGRFLTDEDRLKLVEPQDGKTHDFIRFPYGEETYAARFLLSDYVFCARPYRDPQKASPTCLMTYSVLHPSNKNKRVVQDRINRMLVMMFGFVHPAQCQVTEDGLRPFLPDQRGMTLPLLEHMSQLYPFVVFSTRWYPMYAPKPANESNALFDRNFRTLNKYNFTMLQPSIADRLLPPIGDNDDDGSSLKWLDPLPFDGDPDNENLDWHDP